MVVLEQQNISIFTIVGKIRISLISIPIKVRCISEDSFRHKSTITFLRHLQQFCVPISASPFVERLSYEAVLAY